MKQNLWKNFVVHLFSRLWLSLTAAPKSCCFIGASWWEVYYFLFAPLERWILYWCLLISVLFLIGVRLLRGCVLFKLFPWQTFLLALQVRVQANYFYQSTILSMQPGKCAWAEIFSTPDFLPSQCLCGNFECWTSWHSPQCVILLMAIWILFVSWKTRGNTNIGLSTLYDLCGRFNCFPLFKFHQTIYFQNNKMRRATQSGRCTKSKHQEIKVEIKSKLNSIFLFIWIHDRRRKEQSCTLSHKYWWTGEFSAKQ